MPDLIGVSAIVVWSFAIIVLLPINVFIDAVMPKSREESLNHYPWWQWLLLIPIIISDGEASVPKWIYFPLMGLVLVMGFTIIACITVMIFSLVFGWL